MLFLVGHVFILPGATAADTGSTKAATPTVPGSSGPPSDAAKPGAAAVSWGFAPLRTLSGNSLGSLEHYHQDWAEADMDEVTSRHSAGHPAGPSLLAQKMFAVKAAVHEANKAAEVSTTE